MVACFVEEHDTHRLDFVFAHGRKEAIEKRCKVLPVVINTTNLDQYRELLKEVEVVIGTWESPVFTEEQVRTYFPRLKVVLYAAGSVRYFAKSYLANGVTVATSAAEMAIPVAQMTLSLIVQCARGFYNAEPLYRKKGWSAHDFITQTYPGLYDQTRIGLIGMGQIGSLVARMLKDYDVKVLTFDPFLSDEKAEAFGVEKVSLEALFSSCQVISNHLANNPQTVGMLDYSLFHRMGKTAAFVNTGRGAQVVEADLARAMEEEPLRSAVLDVTIDEPYPQDGPLRKLENACILPHIAGFAQKDVLRFSDWVIRQLDRYQAGLPVENTVTEKRLETMA